MGRTGPPGTVGRASSRTGPSSTVGTAHWAGLRPSSVGHMAILHTGKDRVKLCWLWSYFSSAQTIDQLPEYLLEYLALGGMRSYFS